MIEICCGSYEDALCAWNAGINRIELNQCLYVGGLTPSLGTLILAKRNTNLQIVSMVRPRGAGFLYSEVDYETMLLDCELLLKHGSDGIAFGFLKFNNTIHIERTKAFVELIHGYGKEAVFHRAFDCVSDPFESIELLIDLKVDRVLTSGLSETALEGKELLKQLQTKYGERIEILAGSGINAGNASLICRETGIKQLHSSCRDWVLDNTTKKNGISYALSTENELCYDVVNGDKVKKLLRSIQ